MPQTECILLYSRDLSLSLSLSFYPFPYPEEDDVKGEFPPSPIITMMNECMYAFNEIKKEGKVISWIKLEKKI